MRAINASESLTSREREEFAQEKEVAQLQAEFQLKYKQAELDIKRLETKWTQVLRIPFAIISLPVRFIFGLGYIAQAIKGTEPSDKFWEYLGKL